MALAKNHAIYTFRAPTTVTKDDIERYFSKVYGYKVVKSRVVRIPAKIRINRVTRKRYKKPGYKKFYVEFADKVKFKGFV